MKSHSDALSGRDFRPRIPAVLVLIGMVLGSPGPAAAELQTVVLQGGYRITGDLLRENDESLVLDLGFDLVRVPADAVVERLSPAEEEGAASRGGSGIVENDLFFTCDSPVSDLRSLVDRLEGAVVQISTPAGLGSGFFIHPAGYLLTNFHVIEGETRIKVTRYVREEAGLRRENYRKVRIIATNPHADLALLRIDTEGPAEFPFVCLGESHRLRAGQQVFAIGSPLGLERTVTQGIVSTTGRAVEGMAVIQTTAQINPGNSGGPLFNMRGEAVGVINMKVSMAEGLGFAIPIDVAREFLRTRSAFAYDPDNPNSGFHYLDPPRRRPRKE